MLQGNSKKIDRCNEIRFVFIKRDDKMIKNSLQLIYNYYII
jgi:hypothetical protein